MYHPIHTLNNADDFFANKNTGTFIEITKICLLGYLDVLGKQFVYHPNIEI